MWRHHDKPMSVAISCAKAVIIIATDGIIRVHSRKDEAKYQEVAHPAGNFICIWDRNYTILNCRKYILPKLE